VHAPGVYSETEATIDGLVAAMTIDEKASLTAGVGLCLRWPV
jgi:hypothetical protein